MFCLPRKKGGWRLRWSSPPHTPSLPRVQQANEGCPLSPPTPHPRLRKGQRVLSPSSLCLSMNACLFPGSLSVQHPENQTAGFLCEDKGHRQLALSRVYLQMTRAHSATRQSLRTALRPKGVRSAQSQVPNLLLSRVTRARMRPISSQPISPPASGILCFRTKGKQSTEWPASQLSPAPCNSHVGQ